MQLQSRLPESNLPALTRIRFRVRGIVQGVGFRPFVYQLADALKLSGWVRNDAEGVLIEVEGTNLRGFLIRLETELPLLADVRSIESEFIPADGQAGFEVRESLGGAAGTMIGADVTVCEDCLQEMFSSEDLRHLYPFLNCTNCGPRYTITRAVPYDRANTSMADFALCEACEGEYHNPADRRFHAQPTACPSCGPQLSHSLEEIIQTINAGGIVALKGIGGFHLICDARDDAAVKRLRERKNRDAKPFAIMALNTHSAERFVSISAAEASILESKERPILLCDKTEDTSLSGTIAPDLSALGVMLPYAPLHYLLFHEALGRPEGTGWLNAPQDPVFVVTSANPGGEPLVIGNEEARFRLSQLADLIVDHNRDILIRTDDSVMRMIAGAPAFIRRARGFTPVPVELGEDLPPTLALGGHLKSTICVTRGREAFLSQHIGDVENAETYGFLRETVDHLLSTLDVKPEIVACDLHPDFLSSRFAEETGLPLVRAQHHHAHCAAVAAEHQIEGPLLGLALDGYGYGQKGEAWGGELLRLEGANFQRLGHLANLAAPGGDKAALEPWRLAVGLLEQQGRGDLIAERFSFQPMADAVRALVGSGHATETSSCGRHFDAAASLIGVTDYNRYEGEVAMRLEALVDAPMLGENLWSLREGVLDLSRLYARLADLPHTLKDQKLGAALFHGTLIDGFAELIRHAADKTGVSLVALSGGCFLNRVLSEGLISALTESNITPLIHRQVPTNDGGLSLGQALIAGRTSKMEL
ncbi:carbamoyltransferase HypF [Ponticaulis sp.]|uniref:carbamoyltransferase HypF n=1 Tax=Ponticaulis sp. TaxID=2020902 RepID=UPI000C42BB93|nr:carbamoyltransferase HypF [Ponticaulis sp.]MAF59093.1 carbamoyltransferase HypF [Ponticaulis sp.]MBN03047.1 carbamoyltransferase HypF [Ponticaulis sp.]